jgi:DNA-binding winged helix-turn-helix (wHTH) protein
MLTEHTSEQIDWRLAAFHEFLRTNFVDPLPMLKKRRSAGLVKKVGISIHRGRAWYGSAAFERFCPSSNLPTADLLQERSLRREGDPVSLEPQVFDLLVYLIRNRDRVVSKDDMIAAVWGGRIVSESALTNKLNAARTATGDSGEAQRLIKTLQRRGIRFVSTSGRSSSLRLRQRPRPRSCRHPRSPFPTGRPSPCCRSRT